MVFQRPACFLCHGLPAPPSCQRGGRDFSLLKFTRERKTERETRAEELEILKGRERDGERRERESDERETDKIVMKEERD